MKSLQNRLMGAFGLAMAVPLMGWAKPDMAMLWTAYMQGIDTPEKLAAVHQAVTNRPTVRIAFANSETAKHSKLHDDYEQDEIQRIAAHYGLSVEIVRVPPMDLDEGRTLDMVYRDAVASGDIVVDYSSYWDGPEHDGDCRQRAASVIEANPEKLFVLPYGEIGRCPATSTSLQGMAPHADGSGFANMILTIPVVHGQPGKLTGVSRRTEADTETATFVSPTGWAGGTGDTCPSAAMAATLAAWVYAARGDSPSAGEIVRILKDGCRLPPTSDPKMFAETNLTALTEAIARKTKTDAQGRKELLNELPLNLGGILENWPKLHVHSWGAWTTNELPTCTANGFRERTCAAAGCPDGTQRQTLPALGHRWSKWKPTKADWMQETRRCKNAGCAETEKVTRYQWAKGKQWGWTKRQKIKGESYAVGVFTNTTGSWVFNLPDGVSEFEYVIVAGGGGGGHGNAYGKFRGGGGGGAGGVLTGRMSHRGRVAVEVGAGGHPMKCGRNSRIICGDKVLEAIGGGGGNRDNEDGLAGGSGGGGGGKSFASKGGAGTEGQGFPGGGSGGGGGGATSAGTKGRGGAGGSGYEDEITGMTYAFGGPGGGMDGTERFRGGRSALPTTGGGGEGAYGLGYAGGSGGSGIVIVRYALSPRRSPGKANGGK